MSMILPGVLCGLFWAGLARAAGLPAGIVAIVFVFVFFAWLMVLGLCHAAGQQWKAMPNE